jgi:hypothetical protein
MPLRVPRTSFLTLIPVICNKIIQKVRGAAADRDRHGVMLALFLDKTGTLRRGFRAFTAYTGIIRRAVYTISRVRYKIALRSAVARWTCAVRYALSLRNRHARVARVRLARIATALFGHWRALLCRKVLLLALFVKMVRMPCMACCLCICGSVFAHVCCTLSTMHTATS